MLEPLTDREHEILQLLGDGMTNQEIANQLILSLGTVKAHNYNIFSKLAVSNRTQALRRAQELGLLTNAPALTDPAPTKTAHPTNLPANLTPFIGRSEEVQRLTDLLADARVRLVTILGAGGMGKTALALETARRHREAFPDGTFFVSLAQVADARNIAPAIMDALGLPVQKTGDLRDMLHNRHMLLVLDNFEHLLDGVDEVVDLLQGTTHLKVLVTSRERLNISAEVVFVLGGLKFDTVQDDAAQLLMHYARFANPTFEFRAEDWPHVTRLCRLTQGMPLALVLAAGWLEMLALEEIANEIAHSFDILESHHHDLPERQRSMRATINSSWARLSPAEQRNFAQLSIFRGGFTREAAHEVVNAELRSLQTLINRSFITVKDGRYEIHELLRQFGWEQLQRATHAGEISAAHSEYYLKWLHGLRAQLEGHGQEDALRVINANLDNLRLAWEWALHTRQLKWIDNALDALFNFFTITWRATEGADMLLIALEHDALTDERLANRLRIRLLTLRLQHETERVPLAEVKQCVALAEQHGDKFEQALSLELLGSHSAFIAHDYDGAIIVFEKALDLFQNLNAWFHLAGVYHKLGYSYLQVTGMEALIAYTERELQIARHHGSQFHLRAALGNLGAAALYLGRYQQAEQYYREALAEQSAYTSVVSRSLTIYFVHVLLLQGKFDEGRQLLQTAWDSMHGVLDVNGASFAYALSAFLTAMEGRYTDAMAAATFSLRETRHDLTGALVINLCAAMACCGLGDDVGAEHHLREAFQRSQQMSFYASATWGLPILVLIRAQQEQFETAAQLAALLRSHPLSACAWVDRWELFTRTETYLKTHISTQPVNLQLETVIAEFLAAQI